MELKGKITLDMNEFTNNLREAGKSANLNVNSINKILQGVKLQADNKPFDDALREAVKQAGLSQQTFERLLGNLKIAIDSKTINETEKQVKIAGEKVGKSFGDGFTKAFNFNNFVQSLQNFTDSLQQISKPFVEFESGLAEVSAITGITGNQLDDFGDKARNLAATFGGTATQQLDAFKGILSRLGPAIADSPVALESMTQSINTLAKAGGIDAAQSMDALTTGMLQFKISLADPTVAAQEMAKMMNVMAAGAKFGAAEIPQISQALVVAGSAASDSKISFEETNAAIQALATGGKYGSEAGTALRNVLIKLQSGSNEAGKTLDKMGLSFKELGTVLTTQGLSSALNLLQSGFDKLGSTQEKNVALTELFGAENLSAGSILLNNANTIAELTKQVTGTNIAYEQAAINMDTTAARADRFRAQLNNLFITIGSALGTSFNTLTTISKDVLPLINTFKGIGSLIPDTLISSIRNLGITLLSNLVPSLVTTTTVNGVTTTSFIGLSAAMNAVTLPIALIAAGIIALVGAFVYFLTQTEQGGKILQNFKNIANQIWEGLKQGFDILFNALSPVFDSIISLFTTLYNAFSTIFTTIISTIKSAFGFDNETSQVLNFTTIVSGAFQTLSTILQPIVSIFEFLINVIKVAIEVLVMGLVPVIKLIINIYGFLFNIIKEIALFIADVFVTVWNNLVSSFKIVIGVIISLWDYFENFRNAIINVVKEGINFLIDSIKAAIDVIVNFFIRAWEQLISIVNWFINLIISVGKWLNELFSTIGKFISNALNPLKIAFESVFGFIGGVVNKIIELKNTILEFFGLMEQKGGDALGLGAKEQQKEVKKLNNEIKKTNELIEKPAIKPEEKKNTNQENAKIDKKTQDNAKKEIELFNKYQEQKAKQTKEYLQALDKEELTNKIKILENEKEAIKNNDNLIQSERLTLLRDNEIQIAQLKAENEKREFERKILNAIESEQKEFDNLKVSNQNKEKAQKLLNERINQLNQQKNDNIKISDENLNKQIAQINEKSQKEISKANLLETKSLIQAKLALIQVGNEEQLQQQLDLQKKLLSIDFQDVINVQTPRTTEQEARYQEYLKKINELEFNAQKTRVQITKDENRAKTEIELLDLQRKYEQDLILYKDNTVKKLEIEEDFQQKRKKLLDKQLNDDSLAYQLLAEFTKDLDNQIYDFKKGNKSKEDKAESTRNKAEIEALTEALKNKKISYDEFSKQRTELLNKEKNSAENTGNEIAESLSKSLQKISGIINNNLNKAIQDISNKFITLKTNADGSIAQVEFSLNGLVNGIENNAGAIAGYFGSIFGQMLAAGIPALEAFGKSALLTVIDIAEKMVLANIAAIFTFLSALIPPPFGQIVAAGIIATGMGLLQVAKSAIGAETGQLEGVQRPMNKRGRTDTQLTWVNPKEAILPLDMTKKNYDLLKFWFAGGTTEEYFSTKIMPNINIKDLNKIEFSNIINPKLSSNLNGNDKIKKQPQQNVNVNARSAVEIEMSPLTVSGTDFVSAIRKINKKKISRF